MAFSECGPCGQLLIRRSVHLLQLSVCGHAALRVALRQLEHAMVQAVEARQCHKLELVAHGAQVLQR
jgi:hypothetical protein